MLPWQPEFQSDLPYNLMQSIPHPNNATHKIWSDWADGLGGMFLSVEDDDTTDQGYILGQKSSYTEISSVAMAIAEIKIYSLLISKEYPFAYWTNLFVLVS